MSGPAGLNKNNRNNNDTVIRNRVPDETMNLQDAILNVDTSVLLIMIGCFKLLLLAPLLVLGIVLVSIKTSGKDRLLSNETVTAHVGMATTVSSLLDSTVEPTTSSNAFYENLFKLRNDSVAPIWTSVMLAVSTAMDFLTAFRRAGNTIIAYMLITTVAFVACILCIEYDRIEINSIYVLIENGFTSLDLHRKLYSACVVFASFGFVITFLSIYVGSKMAELEQHRLYLERDGLPAVLTKKDGNIRSFLLKIAKRFKPSCNVDGDMNSETADIDSGLGHTEHNENERHVSWSNHSNKDV